MKKLRIMLSVATAALSAVAFMVACDDDPAPAAAVTADAAPDATTGTDAGGDAATDTKGTVTGTITYTGPKQGPVVIALIEKVPTAPGGDVGKVGGVGVVNATSFPATYSVKAEPGTWFVSGYMSVGEPPHVSGPIPGDPLDLTPTQVTVTANGTASGNIDLIDLPPPDDGGTGDGGDGGDGG